jgi:enoyl-CoA hydratase
MNQDFSGDEVLTEVRGSLGIITLNRPKALNALNIDMIRQILAILKSWEEDAGIQAVLFLGAGERAFSSGGDIKNFHRVGMNYRRGSISLKVASMFFAEEYSLDWRIFHYPKPTIAFMDGITMGGGYGIAGNCKHRIVTGHTVFAMPETGIGFFPDVGSVYHLLRAPDNLGRYLALTASSIGGKDMMIAGLADYFVDAGKKNNLIAALSNAKNYEQTITDFDQIPAGESLFEKHGKRIARLFASDNVPDIRAALAEDGTPFALETLELIESRSPASVLVAAEHLRRSKGQDFDAVIAQDFILTQRFLERNDFYEGIRAAVIDKDRKPVWQPPHIEDVSPRDVASYFEPTGHELQDVTFFRPQTARK